MTQDSPGAPQNQPERLELRPQHGEHAWRNVAFAALGLTALIVGAQVFEGASQKEPANPVCHLPTEYDLISGRVIEVLSFQKSVAAVSYSQLANAPIDPAYLPPRYVRVVTIPRGLDRKVAIPDTIQTPSLGDIVHFFTSRRAPGLPCHYIPNLALKVEPSAGVPQ